MKSRFCVAAAVAILTLLLRSDAAPGQQAAPEKITLYPMDAPHPRLKFRLLPAIGDRIPGNAAVYYGKVKAEENRFFNDRAMWQNIDNWQFAPLPELRDPKVGVPLSDYFFEQGALCDHCNWQLPIGREPFFGILLPEIQESRQFARLLSAKTRIDVARGDYDEAVRHLRLSYALARHVAAGETLVNGLVGVAVCGISYPQAIELIQQPDSPNLYWARSTLPRPFIDFRDAVEVEMDAWAISFPELMDPGRIERNPDQWRRTLLSIWKVVSETTDDNAYKKPPEELVDLCLADISATFVRLLKHGWKRDQLLAMSQEQVVALDMMTQFREFADEAGTAFFLPYPEAMAELKAVQARVAALREESEHCAAMPLMLLPPFVACRTAHVRIERQFAVLQTLEALRLHAARHGALPQRLSDLVDAPVPRDPSTEMAFDYVLEGRVARLRGPTLNNVPFDYEITLGEPAE